MTIPIAMASVAFLAAVSGEMLENMLVPEKIPSSGGSTKCRIGARMAIPTRLTAKNMPNCCSKCRDLDSGYVQNRLPVKLLITAQMNEIVPAYNSLIEKIRVSRFITPKSTIEPNAPTAANLRKRVRSRLFFKVMQAPVFV